MNRLFLHKSLIVRFLCLYLLAAVLCVIVWTGSWLWLPEGLLQGGTGAAVLAGEDVLGGSVFLEWARIFLLNLVLGVLPILAPPEL